MANAHSLLPMPVTDSHSPNTFAHSSVPLPQNARFDLPGSESRLDDSTITGPAITPSTGQPMPTLRLLRNRMQGEDIGDGWILHSLPHRNSKYYYHSDLKLVTTEDMTNHDTRTTFLSKYQQEVDKNRPLETVVYENRAHVVNHEIQTWDNDKSRSKYWIYLSHYPCHHDLSNYAEKEALTMLQLMVVQNLANPEGMAHTPFSMPDIQRYIDFFNFSKTLEASHNGVASAKCFVISNIIANFYESRPQSSRYARTSHDGNRWKMFIILACWGMPPNYLRRFDAAHNLYGRTLQPDAWKSFLDIVRQERAAANVLSGLLLASSVAFLAIQNLVDFAQFFIIMTIGLSLGCVVMGFNAGFDEKLSQLRCMEPPNPSEGRNRQVTEMGRAMEQHYTMLLFSILCFYMALLAFTAYSIYASVFVAKSFTIPHAFYALATSGLLLTMGFILHWNRQFSHY